jgi:hypothetical protein
VDHWRVNDVAPIALERAPGGVAMYQDDFYALAQQATEVVSQVSVAAYLRPFLRVDVGWAGAYLSGQVERTRYNGGRLALSGLLGPLLLRVQGDVGVDDLSDGFSTPTQFGLSGSVTGFLGRRWALGVNAGYTTLGDNFYVSAQGMTVGLRVEGFIRPWFQVRAAYHYEYEHFYDQYIYDGPTPPTQAYEANVLTVELIARL